MTTARDTTRLTNIVDGIFWQAVEGVTGHRFAMSDVHDPKLLAIRDKLRKEYVPTLRRIQRRAEKEQNEAE